MSVTLDPFFHMTTLEELCRHSTNQVQLSTTFCFQVQSDSSRMSTSAAELMSRRTREQHRQRLLVLNLHLLANPGDSLLLQHSLDRLLRWLCPSLHVFHVSERASPHRGFARLCPVAGSPSLAITFFLHEAYGEERILKVLDFFQRPPWQYHHTENCGGKSAGVHISSSGSTVNALLRPYLLPSRDFYSLGAGMPVWGVRPVHCGGEILRVTLYSGYDNYEDAVRFYETVLQQQAEEQKTGFCWFTLHTEPGLCLQLALKQVSAGVRVEACNSAVLQFSVEEIGQLVPLLPNPCTPISTSRWQTEDLDGNKVLFQVKTPTQAKPPLTCAFPLTCPTLATQLKGGGHTQNLSPSNLQAPPAWQSHRHGVRAASDISVQKLPGSQGSSSCCSTPPGSSCYSSQGSSPAPQPASDSPLRTPITRSLSHLLLEEDEDDDGETNVDTGAMMTAITRSSSVDLLNSRRPGTPAADARTPSSLSLARSDDTRTHPDCARFPLRRGWRHRHGAFFQAAVITRKCRGAGR
ncbi:protein FAM124B isoform X1 [Phyllopteryx taeniolatus]|uniref:protein FAM124B isoform X1 n=2 Tax=Phyllopteryx taeniolatus TaxID=161469 RepID=UPI002AD25196|nr:protein FAM124B isoform X1 [Phyllopteryx taeniolatus]